MARRDRVPRHKSHNHRRNKNPKLSPFQRELKRAKLANQAPTAKTLGTDRDIPKSERLVFEFLQKQREHREERRRLLQEQRAEEEGHAKAERREEAHTEAHREGTDGAPPAKKRRVDATETRKPKNALADLPSLNAELTSELGNAVQAFRSRPNPLRDGDCDTKNASRTVEEIISRKKERKHKRKVEARRERLTEKYRELEGELEDALKRGGRKKTKGKHDRGDGADSGGESFNAAFEKKLKQMQAEKQKEEERLKKVAKEAGEGRGEGAKTRRSKKTEKTTAQQERSPSSAKKKSISFSDEVGDGASGPAAAGTSTSSSAPKAEKRPRDFFELVDVVRYGERVEAPPVFDVVPNRSAAVTRLANKLEQEQARPGVFPCHKKASSSSSSPSSSSSSSMADERYRLLSSVGGMGERKRLARLGLAPAPTAPIYASSSPSGNNDRRKEMELLRERVMATYRQNKRREGEGKSGVDMRHQFPLFS